MKEEVQTQESAEQMRECSECEAEARRGFAETVFRALFLVVGLAIMSVGVALSVKAGLGTSPVSSIPYVWNLISGLSVGTTTIIVNTGIVLLQVLLLRRRYRPFQLLQLPVCIAFGLLTDLALYFLDALEPAAYWQQWVLCAGGILLVALGVSFEVAAKVITLAGEGLVLALCALFPRARFGYVKIGVDCSFVVIAVLLSFVFLHELAGVREGTLAAAVFVGLIAKQFNRFMVPFADRLFRPFAAKRES